MVSALTDNLPEKLKGVLEKIDHACLSAGRERSAVKLVAVAKTIPVETVGLAAACGQREFGENYVQEGIAKIRILRDQFPDLKFHFIGRLQRNKVRDVVRDFDLIQTVDRLELAREINKECEKQGRRVEILCQVNISGEGSKSGIDLKNAAEVVDEVVKFPHLALTGLMSIGSFIEEVGESKVKEEFIQLRELRDDLVRSLNCNLPELSMGMSSDFELAIEYGATIVRVGSAIFGERTRK